MKLVKNGDLFKDGYVLRIEDISIDDFEKSVSETYIHREPHPMFQEEGGRVYRVGRTYTLTPKAEAQAVFDELKEIDWRFKEIWGYGFLSFDISVGVNYKGMRKKESMLNRAMERIEHAEALFSDHEEVERRFQNKFEKFKADLERWVRLKTNSAVDKSISMLKRGGINEWADKNGVDAKLLKAYQDADAALEAARKARAEARDALDKDRAKVLLKAFQDRDDEENKGIDPEIMAKAIAFLENFEEFEGHRNVFLD